MGHPIPSAALAQHVIVLGKTRSGKSSTMRGMVEGLLDAGKPVCILDPKGDWWGLKSSADGKQAGYPVIIFGGEHADVPLNAHSGAHVAELIATGNRPCIIDLGGWMPGERTRFFVDFASTLFRHTRDLRWLVIDECHNFAPQGKVLDPDAGKMLHWANRLANEGSGKGLTLISASQRPQKVHKDYVTAHETLVAMRVIHELDRNAVRAWMDGHADKEKSKEVVDTLAEMQRGEAWVWSPEIKFGPTRIQFPMFSTYDSFKAPTGETTTRLKGWASVDLDDVRTKLAAVVEESKANDPKALKAEIARLKKQMVDAAKQAVQQGTTPDPLALEKAEHIGFDRGKLEGMDYGHKVGRLEGYREATEAGLAALRGLESPDAPVAPLPTPRPTRPAQRAIERQHPSPALPKPASRAPVAQRSNGHLPPGERAVLIAAAQFDGVAREQLTVLTGYKRSSRDAYIQRLRERGYIQLDGQTVHATDTGVDALPHDYEPLPIGVDLQAYWLARLPEGERRILEQLIAAYPNSVPRAELDEATGYKRSSRDAYLQRMKAKRLWTSEGAGVRAAEELFR